MLTITLICPNPPGKWPTVALARLTNRSVIPAEFIRFAANRKNGTANKMNELYDFHISLISSEGDKRSSLINTGMQANPNANDTGMRIATSTAKVPNISAATSPELTNQPPLPFPGSRPSPPSVFQ